MAQQSCSSELEPVPASANAYLARPVPKTAQQLLLALEVLAEIEDLYCEMADEYEARIADPDADGEFTLDELRTGVDSAAALADVHRRAVAEGARTVEQRMRLRAVSARRPRAGRRTRARPRAHRCQRRRSRSRAGPDDDGEPACGRRHAHDLAVDRRRAR